MTEGQAAVRRKPAARLRRPAPVLASRYRGIVGAGLYIDAHRNLPAGNDRILWEEWEPMKVVLLRKRKSGLSPQAFRDHYETSQGALTHKYPGHLFQDYRRNYAQPIGEQVGEAPNPGVGHSPYDAITEIWLKGGAAWDEMQKIMADPVIGRIFMEDEENFLDRPALRIFPRVEERRVPAAA